MGLINLLPPLHKRLLVLSLALVAIAGFIPSKSKSSHSIDGQRTDLVIGETISATAATNASSEQPSPSISGSTLAVTQRNGSSATVTNSAPVKIAPKPAPQAPAPTVADAIAKHAEQPATTEIRDEPVSASAAQTSEPAGQEAEAPQLASKPTDTPSEAPENTIAEASENATTEAQDQPLEIAQQVPALPASSGPSKQTLTTEQLLAEQEPVIMVFNEENELQQGMRYQLPLAVSSTPAAANKRELYSKQVQTVKNGDSLALLFSRVGLSAATLHKIDTLGGDAKQLRKIHPGDNVEFYLDDQQQLAELRYPLDSRRTLSIQRQQQGSFVADIEEQAVELRYGFAEGTITSSFWNAGIKAGLSQGQIMSLAGIFGWDVDFAQDIRSGDHFVVLFEEQYINGEFVGYGNIVAAEFTNQGDTFQALRHSDENYYGPEGKPMRKAFLRAPVNFRYISSNFNPRRLHPVTGRVRPHNGIDYAAKVGTPVVAAGDGRVIEAGYNKFNGNYVFIQHSATYVTKYLHLHKRHVKTGQRVRQGKTIGTVGATGRVTGPHLHYEFLVNGVHKNPRTVKLPESKPLTGQDLASFRANSTPLLEQLNNTKRVLLAMR